MKKSKYLNKNFGKWKCVSMGVDRVQAEVTRRINKETGEYLLSRRPGNKAYYYVFECKDTNSGEVKTIVLGRALAAKVYKGQVNLNEYGEKKYKVRGARRAQKVQDIIRSYYNTFNNNVEQEIKKEEPIKRKGFLRRLLSNSLFNKIFKRN